MKEYQLLVLTDHSGHSQENSLYPLLPELRKQTNCKAIFVATRAESRNADFFDQQQDATVWASTVEADFAFSAIGVHFKNKLQAIDLADIDFVLLRLPPPLSKDFLNFLERYFYQQVIFNQPSGIYETGSKAFLMNFQEFCPPMRLCHTKQAIVEASQAFPIVLKPFRDYGGRGIVKIDGQEVSRGKEKLSLIDFLNGLPNENLNYLAVKFLKKVTEGDKRIIVVNGEILGASLRLPAKDSWLCNVAMGGSSTKAYVTDVEREIIEGIQPILSRKGIAMYGVDTLMNDEGERVLSEINTTSIGGLKQATPTTNEPLIQRASYLLWQRFLKATLQLEKL